jgi:septum site-determining protein MinC
MKPRRAIEIKGSALPVLRLVVRDCDAQSLSDELIPALTNARALLAEAVAVLDLRELNGSDVAPSEIVDAARDAGVHLAAVLIGEGSERAALADSGLPIIESSIAASERPAPPSEEPEVAQTAADSAPQAALGPPTPLYLTQPSRSGQQFYAQGRDMVVLAPTSRGSELIADGSIYAFTLLRGRAVAGASGNRDARIIATQFDAELVAIAGVYRTLEAADIGGLANGPVSVTLAFGDGSERLVLRPV